MILTRSLDCKRRSGAGGACLRALAGLVLFLACGPASSFAGIAASHGESIEPWSLTMSSGDPWFRAPGYEPGELLVKFREATTRETREGLARAHGAVIARAITPDGLVKVRLAAGDDTRRALATWRALADVEYAAPNLRAHGFFVPNDTLIHHFDFGWNLWQVRVFDAWDVVTASPDVVVAIIDSGVAFEDHEIPDYERPLLWPGTTAYRRSPELSGPFRAGWDFVHDDAHPNDDHGHGTHVATILAGTPDNIIGSAGIAFGATIMPVKVLDYQNDSSMEWIVQGLRFAADQGADIANLSLGFPPVGLFLDVGFTIDEVNLMFRPLRDAVNYAQRRGVLLVAAAGNFNRGEVSFPAGYPGVIAVGATNVDRSRSSYSSYGKALDFMAPGGDFTDRNGDHVQDAVLLHSMKPNRSATSRAKPDSFNVFPFFGTSGAAPHVAGAAALLMTQGITQPSAIERRLRETSIRPFQSGSGPDFTYGHGLIQLDAAVRGGTTGPDAAAALGRSVPIEGQGIHARLRSENPARGAAVLSYRTARAGQVRLRVFNARGALVHSEDRLEPAGEHAFTWDGRGPAGETPSGVYWMKIETPDGSAVRKVAWLR